MVRVVWGVTDRPTSTSTWSQALDTPGLVGIYNEFAVTKWPTTCEHQSYPTLRRSRSQINTEKKTDPIWSDRTIYEISLFI